jgi:hypothetical protein
VRPKSLFCAKRLHQALILHSRDVRALPGIKEENCRASFVEQVVESLRRIKFAHFIRDAKIDPRRADPSADIFDPLRAAVFYMRKGDIDEACWLIFLFVHFGKDRKQGWQLVRNIYGSFGGLRWTWQRISADPVAFRHWLAANEHALRHGRFGNHRKYETISAQSPKGTAAVVESYVEWVAPPRSHTEMIRDAHVQVGQNPRTVFDYLYQSMSMVKRFGRLAKFDYLTMLGKLGLAPIEPGSAYLGEATGPLQGARLLFGGDVAANLRAVNLDSWLVELDTSLMVGMQVLEDAICNWQKSPNKFKPFRG